jgi:hypothetical protein
MTRLRDARVVQSIFSVRCCCDRGLSYIRYEHKRNTRPPRHSLDVRHRIERPGRTTRDLKHSRKESPKPLSLLSRSPTTSSPSTPTNLGSYLLTSSQCRSKSTPFHLHSQAVQQTPSITPRTALHNHSIINNNTKFQPIMELAILLFGHDNKGHVVRVVSLNSAPSFLQITRIKVFEGR